ncbi:MAG: YheC/YheD family protein [Firmicutes bacterium]|nr:YheC/YheD family protein [Bacillota bacterium]
MAGGNLGSRFGIYALSDGRGGFGQQTELCRDVIRLAHERGMDAFVLQPGFARSRSRVSGYRLSRDGAFAPAACPWPDVVWRRVCCRPRALRAQIADDEAAFHNARVFGLDQRFADKWKLHHFLRSLPDIAQYVPATRLLTRPSDLFTMLALHGDVYVKPRNGTQGRGIARVVTTIGLPRARYELRDESGVRVLRESALRAWALHKPPARYIVQMAVAGAPAAAGERVYDARLLLQHDDQARPVCTATIGRVGARGAITSNLHSGGQAVAEEKLREWLMDGSLRRGHDPLAQARQLCERVFADVVRIARGDVCELGMDIVFGRRAKPFLLELNGCPGRRMLRRTDPALRRLSLVRVLEYADRVGRSPAQRDEWIREGTVYGGS